MEYLLLKQKIIKDGLQVQTIPNIGLKICLVTNINFIIQLKQNKAHILALNKQLGIRLNNFIPIITFSNEADLRVNTAYNVIYTTQINKLIKEYTDIKFQETDIQKLYEKISLLNIVSPEARKQHILDVRNIIATKEQMIQQGICPRCGHSLVFRSGKYGNFFGCSNYPKCRFTKPIEQRNNYFLNNLAKKFLKSLLK